MFLKRFRRLTKIVHKDVGKFDRFLNFGCGSGGFLLAMDHPAGVGFELGAAGTFSVGLLRLQRGDSLKFWEPRALRKGASI